MGKSRLKRQASAVSDISKIRSGDGDIRKTGHTCKIAISLYIPYQQRMSNFFGFASLLLIPIVH